MISFARISAALALAGAIISTPAFAAVDDDTRSVVVRTADLNLSDAAGRATLSRRIANAAAIACGHVDARNLIGSRLAGHCRTDAIANAMPQVQLALSRAAAGTQLASNAIVVRTKAP